MSLRWADEMVGHYQQVLNRRGHADAMMDKAAIYLDLAQLNNTDRTRFDAISAEGDRLLMSCVAVAEEDQKSEVYRYWSRFDYNLARPSSGRL